MRRILALAITALSVIAATGGHARAQQVHVEEFTLDNGMKFLLYPRAEEPNIIAGGWVAKVGSANERPGITGISHFFEHMMFKGTNTIGTNDPTRDAEFRAKQKAARDRLMDLTLNGQYRRWKSGEIDDPWDPANDTAEMAQIRAELKKLMDDQKDKDKGSIVNNEFDKIYAGQGGSGMNAFTNEDVTFYFINVPSNKLELWAWMESDRLNDSVFREFYAERDVVHEERRLRTESTPTGIFQEQFEAMFWQSSPYQWPVIGWTSDLNSYTMEQAKAYFDIYYRPNNVVGVIVGDFKPEEAKPILTKYFGRLKRGEVAPPVVSTLEMKQMAEQRMLAECDCQPQVVVQYKTVPFGHADEAPLEVMAEVLNGRTGRLYKSMIEGAAIASSASANQDSRKYAGAFAFQADTKGSSTPEALEEAWYRELTRLQNEAVPDNELQKVKNQSAANSYRRLQSNFFLLVQIGIAEALGGWEYLNEQPKRVQAVTPADVQRVAKKYFDKTNRTVGIYHRLAGSMAEAEDPEFSKIAEKVGPQMAAGLKKQLEQIKKSTNLDRLKTAITQMEESKASGQVPPQMVPMLDYVGAKVRERIAELEKSGAASTPATPATNDAAPAGKTGN